MKLKTLLYEARKTLVILVAVGGEAIALGLLHGTAAHVVTLLVAAAGAAGVYFTPNVSQGVPPAQP